MKKFIALCASALCTLLPVNAQTLSLDSCRAMALRCNKQLSVSRAKQQAAVNVRKAARTKYLPHVDIVGGWFLSNRELSILNGDQKNVLSNLGTSTFGEMGATIEHKLTEMAKNKIITPQQAQDFGQMARKLGGQLSEMGNAFGAEIRDAFRTDTRSIIAGSVMVNQPIYMGGAVTAANRMADIAEHMAATQTNAAEQNVLYEIDNAYWLVVSLKQKQRLAEGFLDLVSKLSADVHKMIESGVATRADGLKVDVRVNEAEMAKTQVDNGLDLARMLLCQLCGMPLDSKMTLEDEISDNILAGSSEDSYDHELAMSNRPELMLLGSAVDMTEQATKLARASFMPQLALTGGYMISNPNLFNGFEKKFSCMWNLGLLVRIPVFDWGEGLYKVRATKIATDMARLELDEAREKIDLQVNQCHYRLREANKKLAVAQKNIKRAEENLRCANLGFSEGVMQATEVMAAQTAWLQAQTQKIEAQIDVRLGEAGMRKALGIR